MNLICVDPETDRHWARLVQTQTSSLYHSPSWIRALNLAYDFGVRAYVLLDEKGEPVAGMPFCRIEDICGERIIILPFSDTCEPVFAARDQVEPLIRHLIAEECPISVRSLGGSLAGDPRFTLYNRAHWHALTLNAELPQLWQQIDGSARRAIKKASAGGLTVRDANGPDDLNAFYEMHLKVRKHKYRLLAQPRRFFEEIWREFVENDGSRLALVEMDGQVISGSFFLLHRSTLYYKFNASLQDSQEYRPNDLLIWEAVRYAKERGCSLLDLGVTDWDQEGLVRYKRKFASEEKTVHFLRYAPNGHPGPRERQIRLLLSQLTSLYTDDSVPDAITERAGDILYRFFC